MNLSLIKQVAFEQFGNKSSHNFKERGNKYYHGERVAKLALELRKRIFPEDTSHDDILTVAAWFHDIMNGKDRHAFEGAKLTRKLLKGHCSDYELEEVCRIISVHDDRKPGTDVYDKYVKLQQDADHLDHFGTYDVWSEFLYAIHRDNAINDVIEWFRNERPNYDPRFRADLNFEISMQIYDEKSRFLKNFGERLCVEFSGGFWGLDELLENKNEQKVI